MELPIGTFCSVGDVVQGSSSDEIIIKNFLNVINLRVIVNTDNTLSFKASNVYSGLGVASGYNEIQLVPRYFMKGGKPYIFNGYYSEAYDVSTNATVKSTTQKYDENNDVYEFIFNNYNNGVNDGFMFYFDDESYEYFGSFGLHFFDAPYTATQTLNSSTTNYNVNVSTTPDPTDATKTQLQITNLLNKGIFYENEVVLDYYQKPYYGSCTAVPLIGTIDADGSITIPAMLAGGGVTGSLQAWGTALGVAAYWESNKGLNYYFNYMCSTCDGTNVYDITGQYTPGKPVHQVFNDNYWVSDGGQTKTYENANIHLDKVAYYTTNTNSYLAKADEIDIPYDYEITHQVDFDQVAVAYHANHPGEEQDVLWIKGQLDASSIKNAMYVDHYELHLLPGSYTTVSGDEFNNADKGHDNGLNISDESFHHAYYPNDIATYAEGDKTDAEKAQEVIDANSNGQFCRLVKKSDFDTAGIEMDPNNQYTLYLKTVYTGASDLEPTFHALTSVNGTTTGVDNIVNEENIADINVNGATVTISGSNGNALVVTTSGVVVYQGGDNTVTLTPGMYIVRADKLTKRIIIK